VYHSYERVAIEQWFQRRDTSPKTNEVLESTALIPNHTLRGAIESFLERFLRELDRGSFTVGRRIGGGSFKTVHEGSFRGKKVAVLKVRAGSCDQEAKVLLRLGRHPHLVQYFGRCKDSDVEYLLTELATHGSLWDLMEEQEEALGQAHVRVVMQQVYAGMFALAQEGIVLPPPPCPAPRAAWERPGRLPETGAAAVFGWAVRLTCVCVSVCCSVCVSAPGSTETSPRATCSRSASTRRTPR